MVFCYPFAYLSYLVGQTISHDKSTMGCQSLDSISAKHSEGIPPHRALAGRHIARFSIVRLDLTPMGFRVENPERRGSKGAMAGFAFYKDGSVFASASADHTVGRETRDSEGIFALRHTDKFRHLAFPPDGATLASASHGCLCATSRSPQTSRRLPSHPRMTLCICGIWLRDSM